MLLASASLHLRAGTFPLASGDVTLDNYPEYGDDLKALSSEHKSALSALAARISQSLSTLHPARIIYIVGHADVALREAAGQHRANLELEVSQRRAKAVRKILDQQLRQLSNGASRILVTIDVGAGTQRLRVPVARTEADMRKNRRVEIHVAFQNVGGDTCAGTTVG